MPERYDINGNPIGFFSVEDEGMRYVDPTIIQPAVVSANRKYWEAQKWARENVRDPRERTAPYVAAGLGATMAAPFALDLGAVAIANPYVRTALDVAGNIDGARNLVSGNGVQKTIRLANSGDTWGAVKSGIGDILDLSGAGDLIRTARKFNRANRTLHAFNAIEPFGYTKHFDRAKAWVKDIMEDVPVDIENPSWYTKRFKDRIGSAIPSENKVGAAELGGRTRFDAWRLYNGLPQKYGMYIKSPDGTYAYNLQEAQHLVDDLKPDFFGRVGEYSNTIDTFTSAGGNLEYDNLYDFGRDLVNPNLSYELREIKDTWDLHPFSRDYNEAQKIQDSAASNGIYENLNWESKPNRWINKMLRNVELGQITGGRPFTMRTEIPHTIDFTLYPEQVKSSIGFNGTKNNEMPQAVLDYQSGMSLQDIVKKHNLPVVDMAHISDLKTRAYGGLLDRLNKHYNGDRSKIIQAMQYARGGFKRDEVSDKDGSQYYDIVRQRRNSVFNALMRAGMNPDDAARLTPMIVTQQTMEGGWVLNRKDNNFGGMKINGTQTISYDSEDAFQDAYIKMLDSKWHNGRAVENSWRSARNLDDWARILNREDLGLSTKEAWEKYNRGKQGNDFVYLYAPQWENNNKPYREHLKKTEDRTAAYLKMVEADEPLMSLSPRMEERAIRQMPPVPEQPSLPLGLFRTLIPTSVQQKMPAAQNAPTQQQAPLFRTLIPTSVQKKMNNRAGGGLIERYGVDKVRAAMQKVKR